MAVHKEMASGLEEPCYRCGKRFQPGDMKIERRHRGNSHTQSKTWVCESCSPGRKKGGHNKRVVKAKGTRKGYSQ